MEAWREEWVGLHPTAWPIAAHRIEFAGSGMGFADYLAWLDSMGFGEDEAMAVIAGLA